LAVPILLKRTANLGNKFNVTNTHLRFFKIPPAYHFAIFVFT